MTPKSLAGLAVVAGVTAIIAGGFYGTTYNWSSGKVTGKLLLPALSDEINTVEKVKVAQAEKSLTFEKSGDNWIISEKDGYVADNEKLRSLVVRLSNARLIDGKTELESKHHLLELEDPTKPDAQSRRVQLLDNSDKILADVVVGKKKWDAFGSGKSGAYVRHFDEVKTWLANLDADPSLDVADWVDTKIFEFKTSDIKAVEVNWPGEDRLHIKPNTDEKDKFKFVDLLENKKLKEEADASAIARAFDGIDLQDVRKLDTAQNNTSEATTTLHGDGLKIVFDLRKEKDQSWISIHAEADKNEEARKTAQKINDKTEGWEFRISDWKAKDLFKNWSDLLETS